MMICKNCNCANECGWYKSYDRIETEVYTGIGTDNTLGRALVAVLRDNELHSCKYYEGKKSEVTDIGEALSFSDFNKALKENIDKLEAYDNR